MGKCYVCGISEEETFLYKGISKSGFVDVCRKCYKKKEIPLVENKPIKKEFEKVKSVRERLMALSGLKKDPETQKDEGLQDLKKELSKGRKEKNENVSLNDIIEKNFKKNLPKEKKEYTDLIENFHWIIMRKRRTKKLNKEQFAKMIYEPSIVVEYVEKAILPKDYRSLIRKIENALDIRIFKEQEFKKFDPSNLAEESKFSTGLTTSDLKSLGEKNNKKEESLGVDELNLKKVEEIVGKPYSEKKVEEKIKKNSEKANFQKDISQEEIDKIIFGGKKGERGE